MNKNNILIIYLVLNYINYNYKNNKKTITILINLYNI